MYRIRDYLTTAKVVVALVALAVAGAVAYAVLELLPSDGGGSSTERGIPVRPGFQPLESWHLIGTANEPPFAMSSQPGCSWHNRDRTERNAAAFYRDRTGIVHLRGEVVAPGSCDPASPLPEMFTLPAGYRPPVAQVEPSGRVGSPGFPVTITVDGVVRPRKYSPLRGRPTHMSLYDITFRCGPSGQHRCP